MNMPEDLSLPFFAYGTLRPGEPAYPQISAYVNSSEEFMIPGYLYVRDGLPLMEYNKDTSSSIFGYLLRFSSGNQKEAYEAICRFEPHEHYQWKKIESEDGLSINILVGIRITAGSEPWEEMQWSSWKDPVFDYGLDVIRENIFKHCKRKFQSAPPDCFDWKRFFTLQMNYLLLWSAIERFCALAYGPALKPMEKIEALSKDERVIIAIQRNVMRQDRVFDVRNPKEKYRLDNTHSKCSILYYYQIRNNLSHRGKGAWNDGEKVRLSLSELFAIFDQVLNDGRAYSRSLI